SNPADSDPPPRVWGQIPGSIAAGSDLPPSPDRDGWAPPAVQAQKKGTDIRGQETGVRRLESGSSRVPEASTQQNAPAAVFSPGARGQQTDGVRRAPYVNPSTGAMVDVPPPPPLNLKKEVGFFPASFSSAPEIRIQPKTPAPVYPAEARRT